MLLKVFFKGGIVVNTQDCAIKIYVTSTVTVSGKVIQVIYDISCQVK